jgi:hypothetical protein
MHVRASAGEGVKQTTNTRKAKSKHSKWNQQRQATLFLFRETVERKVSF